jgi:catechol 2,3-dioxygenase-like lactoylglutathione lyase family enzyme
MNRFHVHVGVDDLAASIRFYSTLFAAEPTVRKPDYAKWMLDNPRVNFAISQGRIRPGIHHLGIQAEDDSELTEIYGRLVAADAPVRDEDTTVCCYAKSTKCWISDPQGIAWETFVTHGDSTVFGGNGPAIRSNPADPPAAKAASCGCGPAVAAE